MQRLPNLLLFTCLAAAPFQAHAHEADRPAEPIENTRRPIAPTDRNREGVTRERGPRAGGPREEGMREGAPREGATRANQNERPEAQKAPESPLGNRIRNFPRLTPEQQQERRKAMRQQEETNAKQRQVQLERSVRNLIARFGFAGPQLQDAIIAHMVNEVKARGPVRNRSRALTRTLQSGQSTPEQMARTLTEYKAAIDADTQRRLAAEAELNAKIDYKNNPRMEAMLLLYGIIGESSAMNPWRPQFPMGDDNRNRTNRTETRDQERPAGSEGRNAEGHKEGQPEAGLPLVEKPEAAVAETTPRDGEASIPAKQDQG